MALKLKYLNFTGLSTLVSDIKTWVLARIPTKTSEITNDSGFITSSSLPTVNNATLTIQKNGNNVQTFTANASSNKTANITVPTKTSELTNDSGYLTSHQDLSLYPYKVTSFSNYGNGRWLHVNLGDTTTYPNGFNGIVATGKYHVRWTNATTVGVPFTTSAETDGILEVEGVSSASGVSSYQRIVQRFYRCHTAYTVYFRYGAYHDGAWNWSGWTSYGDIVTHSASEFLTSHQSLDGYLPLTGGTVTGDLIIKGATLTFNSLDTTEGSTTYRTNKVIESVSSNSKYGLNVLFGSSCSAVLGAGEGKNSLLAELAGTTNENAYIIADNSIYFHPGANQYANKKTVTLDSSANLSGLSTVTAMTFSGNLTGNCSGTSANVTETVAIANGGTGATTRTSAVANLFNANIGSSPSHFLTGTSGFGNSGYSSVADVKTALGLGTATFENNTGRDANTVTFNGINYYSSNGPAMSLGASTNDGALYSQAWSDKWVAQIAQDYRNGNLFVRGKNNGIWQAWKAVAYHGDNVSKFTNDAGYLTAHQSLSNYVTLNGAQTITKQKTFTVQPAVKCGSYELGATPSSTQYAFMEFFDKNNEQSGWVGRAAYTNGHDTVTLYCGNKFTNGAKATDGTRLGAVFEVGLNPAGVAYLNTNAGWMSSIYPMGNRSADLGSATYQWSQIFANGANFYYGLNTGCIEMNPDGLANRSDGGYIDFHYNHSTADFTSRIIEDGSGLLNINGVKIPSGTGKIHTQTASLVKGTNPSAVTWTGLYFNDKTYANSATHRIAAIEPCVDTNGTTHCYMRAYNWVADNQTQVCIAVHYPVNGTPYTEAPTPATSDNSTKIATTAYVKANAYTHPTSAGNKHIPSGGSADQYLKYSSSGTAVWADLIPIFSNKVYDWEHTVAVTEMVQSSDWTAITGGYKYTASISVKKGPLMRIYVYLTTTDSDLVKITCSNIMIIGLRNCVDNGKNSIKADTTSYGNILTQTATGSSRLNCLAIAYNSTVTLTITYTANAHAGGANPSLSGTISIAQ